MINLEHVKLVKLEKYPPNIPVERRVPIMLASTWEFVKASLRQIDEEEAKVLQNVGANTGDDGDDIRHNPVYDAAALSLKLLAARRNALIGELQGVEEVIIYEPPTDPDSVSIGCQVELSFEDGTIEQYNLGSSLDAKAHRGWISWDSPLGRSIIGAKRGETRSYRVGSGTNIQEFKVTIVSISPAPTDQTVAESRE